MRMLWLASGGEKTVRTTLQDRIINSIVHKQNTRLLRDVLGDASQPVTQNALAVMSGLDRATVQRWEKQGSSKTTNGHHVGPLPRSLEKYARFVKMKLPIIKRRVGLMRVTDLRRLRKQYL